MVQKKWAILHFSTLPFDNWKNCWLTSVNNLWSWCRLFCTQLSKYTDVIFDKKLNWAVSSNKFETSRNAEETTCDIAFVFGSMTANKIAVQRRMEKIREKDRSVGDGKHGCRTPEFGHSSLWEQKSELSLVIKTTWDVAGEISFRHLPFGDLCKLEKKLGCPLAFSSSPILLNYN